mgnify:CR=1 FL=1
MLRFSCEKALLQGAVNTASRAVAAKSSIPALEGILLEGGDTLTLSGYNMQTGIRTGVDAQIQSPGRIVLSARLFGEMIRKMPDDVIVFDADDKLTVHLTCGDASFEIIGLSADDYPELPEVDDQFSVDIRQGTLKAMINQTSFAVSTNESRPVHTGSLFEVGDKDLTVVSVDGFRLALRREPLDRSEGGAFKFVAPGSALNEVEKICEDSDEKITIIQGKRHLLFEAGATQLICRRLEGDFLDYKNAIPRNNPIRLTVDTKTMLGSLDRVSVVISEKLKSPVRCVFENGRVMLSARTGAGEAKDNAKVIDAITTDLAAITGQKPVVCKARKSVANFKLREGMNIGVKVTLRGDRMYEFLDRLFNVALPRVRDFRGINPNSFDGRGNYNMGIKEQLIFPEIDYDKIDKVRGMDICFVTTANNDEEARELLSLMGAPFAK